MERGETLMWVFIIGGILMTAGALFWVWTYTTDPVDIDPTLDAIRRIK